MSKREVPIAFILSIIGGILILINGLWIAMSGSVFVTGSYPVSSVDQLNSSGFWGRISFGIPAVSEGGLMILWLIFAVVLLLTATILYLRPRENFTLNGIIVICAILSIAIGGGFFIGFIMALVGGLMGTQWPKQAGQTFIGRFLRVLRLDSTVFAEINEDPGILRTSAWMLILVNMLAGFGYGIYIMNINGMNSSANTKFDLLLLGNTQINLSPFYFSLLYIGAAFIKWFTLILIVYFTSRLFGGISEPSKIGIVTAFAYAPVALQVFMPIVLSNQPSQWGLAVFFVTNAWMILALVIGLKESLKISAEKAVGTVMLAGSIYWILAYKVIIPFLQVEGIWLVLDPASFVLLLFAIGAVIATLLGVFTKR